MLLNFTAKNYKSFADEMRFSMKAAPRQGDLKYSLFKSKSDGKEYKVQCSSVIYGPNAGGKSNIISAIDTFKAIILRGNIKNTDITVPNIAAAKLEFIPNINNSKNRPVEFEIEFIENDLLFKYTLSIDIGSFLDGNHHRRIISEELFLNNKTVFKRNNGIKLGEYKFLGKYLLIKQNESNSLKSIADKSLNAQELFLTTGFKVMFSPKLVNTITNWFDKKLTVIYRADTLRLISKPFNSNKQGIFIETATNKAVKIFGASSNEIGYLHINDDDSRDVLCSIINLKDKSEKFAIPAESFESYGTVRFVNLFPIVLKAFSAGATLIVDEFDASIHPSAVMNIINMFHNDDINKNHAQLIFNTHNPVFLNSNLFRRDEIKFVQRAPDTNSSEVYSLSDFGTSGAKGVRNSTDYMKYYLDYNYGAIEDIDFTSVFENISKQNGSKDIGGE